MGNVKKLLFLSQTISPALFANRIVIEWCENVHFHFKNLRFELAEDDFLELCSAFFMAQRRLWQKYKSPFFLNVPIKKIDPWDNAHRAAKNPPGFECTTEHDTISHIEGINFFIKKIKKGENVFPILVRPDKSRKGIFKRMDGFKRFMAFKQLGFQKIPAIVDHNAIPGGQENIEWSLDGKGFRVNLFKEKRVQKPDAERFEILSEYEYNNKVPFQGRLAIELQEDHTLHLHYNNLRIEFKLSEFIIFTKGLLCAFYKLLYLIFTSKKAFGNFLQESFPQFFAFLHPTYRKFIKIFELFSSIRKYKTYVK